MTTDPASPPSLQPQLPPPSLPIITTHPPATTLPPNGALKKQKCISTVLTCLHLLGSKSTITTERYQRSKGMYETDEGIIRDLLRLSALVS